MVVSHIGIVSAVLASVSGLIGVWAVSSGVSRPSFPAYMVFILSLLIAIISGESAGGSLALIPGTVNVVGLIAVITIAFIKKSGNMTFGRFEVASFLIVILGLIAWLHAGFPKIALVAATVIDAVGISLVIRKQFYDFDSESLSAWFVITLAYLLPIVFATSFEWVSVLYSLTNAILCGVVTVVGFLQRQKYILPPKSV